MKNESDVRVYKNKKCQKVLPEGYKHRYCEACRNKHAQTAKNVLIRILYLLLTGQNQILLLTTYWRTRLG